MSPQRLPRRSRMAFVATVVPWTTAWSARKSAPVPRSAAMTPSAWWPGVDGTLATRTSCVSPSTMMRSVNVPPTSTPARNPICPLPADVGLLGVLVGQQRGTGVRERDAAVLQDIGEVGHGEGLPHVLLD